MRDDAQHAEYVAELKLMLAEYEAEVQRLRKMICDHVKYGWNTALFNEAARNDGAEHG